MTPEPANRPVALITGASAGLGLALAHGLADRGWALVIDARGADALKEAADALADRTDVVPLAGDITDPEHRADLADALIELGRVDLLINNASYLGPSPLQKLADADLDELRRVHEVNVVAPIALTQAVLPQLAASAGVVINISSDAAVEAYEGWGGYGATKAALDHASRVLAEEHPALAVYAVDPGDLRTAMHQAAFPGEDISDRPEPATVVPAFLRLLDQRPASGRYRAAEFAPAVTS
ncbi:SDR family oxidoreductase [Kribbella sandramycini]|uniref:NAD(P)-dependent dehydrogenase (Short-subunit alcohol dehydrogenase family) n=1 Tax=Kribbella sandramycini TaxID=60450 RepID=A0A7Y4L032_9ACTN|nr:SDR family oxidoreductase [Kribbella sandramycini]MBB6565581.1 NAD(P)-dependent dehydrogenase (short-subunit alcohol dehydrogenase family) [Kribbella sandramycini]NOL41845.1 SDR family oxidoreductase [Kribbella sandramycini]